MTNHEQALRDLRALNRRYGKQAAKAETLREQRNDAIRAAVDAGIRPGTIARELGLTRPRIRQILGLD